MTIVLYKTIFNFMKIKLSKSIIVLSSLFLLFSSCSKKKEQINQGLQVNQNDVIITENKKNENTKSVAVFVPGILADSPIYSMLVDGVKNAVEQFNYDKQDEEKAQIYVLEAGTNQAQWPSKLTALAATKKYDVIISSNPSLPELVIPITEQFPNQKFILLDAECAGNKNIYSVRYNQYEQAFITGYFAGLMSKSHKIALIAAQEYSVMNEIIYPYFEKGAKKAESSTVCEFRVVGNWYDANKGAVIADSLIKNGTDIILPICGGASQGVINSAVNNGAYITWFDNDGFDKAPGTIISSTVLKQREMADIVTANYLAGLLSWGNADMVGVADKYVSFIQDNQLYIQNVPEKIQKKMSKLISDIENGKYKVN